MRGGRRVAPAPDLATIRAHAREQLAALAPGLRRLAPAPVPYRVEVSDALRALAAEVDRRGT